MPDHRLAAFVGEQGIEPALQRVGDVARDGVDVSFSPRNRSLAPGVDECPGTGIDVFAPKVNNSDSTPISPASLRLSSSLRHA